MSVELTNLIARCYDGMHCAIRDERMDEYMLSGGRGSAKSSVVSIEIILMLLRDPECNAIALRKVANTIKDSVFTQMQWAIDQLGLTDLFEIRRTPYEHIYRKTGQRILYRGADKPEKIKSIKLRKGYFGAIWFEEAKEFDSMEDIGSIKASLLRGAGEKKSVTFYTYNPPRSANNFINRERMQGRAGRMNLHTTYRDVPRAWLGEAFMAEVEAVRLTNDMAYRNTYLGEVTGTGGRVFDNVQLRRITDEELARFDRIYRGIDWGYAVDPYAYVQWAFDRRTRTLYAVDELYAVRMPMETLAERVKQKAGRSVVTCDSADMRSRDDFIKYGVNAVSAKKGPNSRERGFRFLQDLGAIVIDETRTPNIAREFRAYEYARNKDGDFIAQYPDGGDHTIDATRYALESEINQSAAKVLTRAQLGI